MSKEDPRFVVGLGEVLWDKLYKNGKPVRKGKKLSGAPANFAYHVSHFGHEGLVVSAVGLDGDGDELISELNAHNVAYHLDRVLSPTGTVDADITDPNAPKYTIHTRCAWSHIPVSDELIQIAKNTKAVCFGSLAQWGRDSRRAIRLFLDYCPDDCVRVCDINLRQRYFNKSIIKESLRRADILKLNEEELSMITGLLGYQLAGAEVLCRRLMKAYRIEMLILTAGADGSSVLWKGGKSVLGTPKVKVKSAVGAGDSFTAAFIGNILNGNPVEIAHKVSVMYSAFICTQEGAMPTVVPEELINYQS